MLSEDTNEKSINLAVRIGKLTGSEIKRALERMLDERKKAVTPETLDKTIKQDEKQDVKQDEKQDSIKTHGRANLNQFLNEKGPHTTIELRKPNLRLLNRIMKEHEVGFAIAKDGKGKYTLFFKCDNIDSITKGYKQYARKMLNRSRRKASIKQSLSNARKVSQVLSAQRKEKNFSKGGLER